MEILRFLNEKSPRLRAYFLFFVFGRT